MPQTNFFRYLKVRSFIKDHCSTFPRLQADLPKILDKPETWIKTISKLYTGILQANPSPQITAKQGWEKELGIQLQDPWWERAKLQVNSSSSCAHLNLIQFKVLHRMHFSKAKLAKTFPGSSEACNRCAFVPADLLEANRVLEELFHDHVISSRCSYHSLSAHCHFGVPSNYSEFSKPTLNVLAFASLTVSRRILLHWKLPKPPAEQSWQTDLMSFLQLEKIKFSLRGSTEKFYTTWQPLISYFCNVATTPTV